MSGVFHQWNGGYTLVAVGSAFLALSVMLPHLAGICLLAGGASLLAAAGRHLLRRRRRGREDVSELIESARRFRLIRQQEGEEDDEDGEDRAAPYCAECDEVYYPGSRRCLLCGRPLI